MVVDPFLNQDSKMGPLILCNFYILKVIVKKKKKTTFARFSYCCLNIIQQGHSFLFHHIDIAIP
jgi:hypothetical protein